MILIIAPPDDPHARAVSRAVRALGSEKVAILDAADYPHRCSLSVTPSGWILEGEGSMRLSSEEITSIWWRRARPHAVSEHIADPSARRFTARECAHSFDSLPFWGDYLVVNPVDRETIANRKPIQLKLAAELGFKVPRTLVTNAPASLAAFARAVDRPLVFKVLTAPISSFGETRRLLPEHAACLASLPTAPVIFQEELDKEADIRATVVGERVFACRIEVRNPAARAFPDWRLDATARCLAIELPRACIARIRTLMARLGLYYAAIDFIQTRDGALYFLEVNPGGQFLFVEIDTGQEISAALAGLLLEGAKKPAVRPDRLDLAMLGEDG
jgi:hypothetical protein